jgi:hypothetical protein
MNANRKAQTLVVSSIAILVCAIISLHAQRSLIGRNYPRLAALLSPPAFNFDETYSSGDILDFKIGIGRVALMKILKDHYAADSLLLAGCVGQGANTSLLTIDSPDGTMLLEKQPDLCIWTGSKRRTLVLSLRDDVLVRVRLIITSIEGL